MNYLEHNLSATPVGLHKILALNWPIIFLLTTISGVGFVRYLYKVVQPDKFKATCRLAYNVGCLPLTLYSKEMWFGQPVYIFDDNRLWIESNFTLGDVFEQIE